MAKATKAVAKKEAPKEVATTTKKEVVVSNVDVSLLREQATGMGVSTDAADNIVPLIYVLQAQSPQVLKQKAEYIKGAEAGMFWPRGSKEVWNGDEEGVKVVPCHFERCWLEWLPDRGGFVGRHKEKPADAELVVDPKDPKKKAWKLLNGNSVQESREYVVLVLDKYDVPSPFVISFTGSNHGAARGWMSAINKKLTPKGAKAGIMEYVYTVMTIPKSNEKGDWYGLVVDDTNERTSDAVFLEAHKLAKMFSGGELKAAEHIVEDTSVSDDTSII